MCDLQYPPPTQHRLHPFFFDPQTADGLLLCIGRSDTGALLNALKNVGVAAMEVGEVLPQGSC
jgi:selenophosphate synthase